MFKGRNTIGLLSSKQMLDLLLRPKDKGHSTHASTMVKWATFFESALSQDVFHRPKAPLGQIRRRREITRLDASTTCRLLKLLLEHQLWRVCFSPMATPALYSLILEHRILLSVQFVARLNIEFAHTDDEYHIKSP